jgi:hypothetical protein
VSFRKKSGESHRTLQLEPSQLVVAPVNNAQTSHEAPQPSTLVGSRQRPLQSRNPGRQLTVHTPLLQAASEPLGAGQAVQRKPHEAGLESETQLPSQSWLPGGQEPTQPVSKATQAPSHSLRPKGHCPPQATPSHVASPPSGTAQGSHETSPHVAGSSFLTHTPSHECVPGEQPSIGALGSDKSAGSTSGSGSFDSLVPDIDPFEAPATPGSASNDGGARDSVSERSCRSSTEHAPDIAAMPMATRRLRVHITPPLKDMLA